MIILHTSTENNYKTNGLGLLDRFIIAPNVHWEMNGEYSLEFDYPLHAHLGQELENEMQIEIVTDKYSDVFRIKKIEKSMGMLTVYCEHKSYDLIDNFIEDINLVRTSGDLAVERISAGAQYEHPFRITSTIERTASARMVRMGVMEALLDDDKDNSFINRWGGEIYRHYNQVQMHDTIGKNRGVSITHRKDLVGYNATLDHTEVVTRIRPIGKDAFTIPELYVDSPLIDHYPHPKIKEIKYDVEAEGQEHSGEEALPIKEAEAELRRLARLEYSKYNIDKPKGVYEIDFVALENMREYEGFEYLQEVHGGDTVEVIHEEDGLNIFARVMEYDLNPINGEYTFMRLGEYTDVMSVLSTIPTKKEVNQSIENNKKELVDYYTTMANGKNKVLFSDFEPAETEKQKFLIGDMWYQSIGDGDKTMHIWNGEFWEPYVSTTTIDAVSKRVETAETEAQAALENTSTQKTDITALQDRAGAIESDIVKKNTAIQDDIRAINTNIGGVKGDISGIRTNIESLQGELVETEPGTLAYRINEVDKTADGITASLGSYAKTTDLDGLASETYVTNQLTLTEQGFDGKLVDYAKTTDLTGLASETYVNSQVTAKADELSLKMDDYALSTDLTGLATEEYAKTQATTEAGKVSGQLVNYAKKTDLTGLASEEYARTQASAEAGKVEVQLTNYATKSYVDEIEIGGRNYVPLSNRLSINGTHPVNQYQNLPDGSVEIYSTADSILNYASIKYGGRWGLDIFTSDDIGKEFVASFEVLSDKNVDIYYYTGIVQRYVQVNNLSSVGQGKWVRVWVKLNVERTKFKPHISLRTADSTMRVRNFKVELGSKPTDWSPAPEDMATTTSLNSVKATADGNTSNISKILGDNTVTAFNNKVETAYGDTQTLKQDLSVGGTTYTLIHETKNTADEHTSTIARLDSNIKDNSAHYQSLNESFNTFKRTVNETYLAVGKTNGNATSLQLTDGSILAGIVKDGTTNKLHLTDQYFYGGSKFITDHVEATYAEMDNLRVNNTIDAANVNLINLNAANITSGSMSSNRMRVDGDFEMRGKAIRFTNNGELSTIIDRERIHMYDQTNNARYVGSMGATRLLDYQDVSYMSLRHQSPSYMSLDYRGTDSQGNVTYLPYVVFDAYKVNPYNNDSFFTRFLESTRFYKNTRFDGDNYFTSGSSATGGSSALGIRSYTDRMFIGNMVNLTGLMIYRGGTITVMENGTGKYNLHSVTPS